LQNPVGTGQEQEFQAKVKIGDEDVCGDLVFDSSYENGVGWWGENVSLGRKATLSIHGGVPEAASSNSSKTSAANLNPYVFNSEMSYQVFYEKLKKEKLFESLNQKQIDTISAIMDYWKSNYSEYDIRGLAYIFATAYNETDRTMQPIEEPGHGVGLPFGKPDPNTGQVYYGRGLVGLTWERNYKTMGDLLGLDLVNHPEQALQLSVSVRVLVDGMMRGLFTGKSVPDYINSKNVDWINARRIINGLDKADAIAGYAQQFFAALQAASVSPT
jgi:putative chitinase